MWGEFAVVGEELKDKLVEAGFEIIESKVGKYTTVYYFNDTEELWALVDDYLNDYM